jgi:leucyl-tRNA synthetase
MRDLGLIANDEPAANMFTQGMVLGHDGTAMSKSKGNTVDPEEMVDKYGADTCRLFVLFAAPPEKDMPWSEASVGGQRRFLERVWKFVTRNIQGNKIAQGLRKLRLFNQKADVVASSQFASQVFRPEAGLTVNFRADAPQFELRGADPEAIRSLALTLRFFLQEQDGVSFWQLNRIYDELGVSDKLKERATLAIRALDTSLSTIAVNLRGESVTYRRVLDVFLYGSLAHSRGREATEYERWMQSPHYEPFMWLFFQRAGAELLRAAAWFRTLNDEVIESVSQVDLGQSGAMEPKDPAADRRALRKLHRTIHKMTDDFNNRWHFNTSIAALMELINTLSDEEARLSRAALDQILPSMVLLLGPFAPYMAEELWEQMGRTGPVFKQAWPVFDESIEKEDAADVVLQVNGKVRGRIAAPFGTPKEELERLALADPQTQAWIAGKQVVKVIVVPDKLVNIVVK